MSKTFVHLLGDFCGMMIPQQQGMCRCWWRSKRCVQGCPRSGKGNNTPKHWTNDELILFQNISNGSKTSDSVPKHDVPHMSNSYRSFLACSSQTSVAESPCVWGASRRIWPNTGSVHSTYLRHKAWTNLDTSPQNHGKSRKQQLSTPWGRFVCQLWMHKKDVHYKFMDLMEASWHSMALVPLKNYSHWIILPDPLPPHQRLQIPHIPNHQTGHFPAGGRKSIGASSFFQSLPSSMGIFSWLVRPGWGDIFLRDAESKWKPVCSLLPYLFLSHVFLVLFESWQGSIWNTLHNPNKIGRSAVHVSKVNARCLDWQLAAQEIVEHGLCPVSIQSHLRHCLSLWGRWIFFISTHCGSSAPVEAKVNVKLHYTVCPMSNHIKIPL